MSIDLFFLSWNRLYWRSDGSLNATTSNGSLFANNVEFTGVGGEISWKSTNLGVSLGYQTAISGKLIYAAPSYSAGVFYLDKWVDVLVLIGIFINRKIKWRNLLSA